MRSSVVLVVAALACATQLAQAEQKWKWPGESYPDEDEPLTEPTNWETPTMEPTKWDPPTMEPTKWVPKWEAPTMEPTKWDPPTMEPTKWDPPTMEPTKWDPPTMEPTKWVPPTMEPTEWVPPTMEPTEWVPPTMEPTEWVPKWTPPTMEPTEWVPPTMEPTEWVPKWTPPTMEPTEWVPPTMEPTEWVPKWTPPTMEPTEWVPPTMEPTEWVPKWTPPTMEPTKWVHPAPPPKPGKCNYECPKHSKPKKKDQCCDSVLDCKCDWGWKMVAHKGKCVRKDPPKHCPSGAYRKKCCAGEPCYTNKDAQDAMLELFGSVEEGDDDFLVDEDSVEFAEEREEHEDEGAELIDIEEFATRDKFLDESEEEDEASESSLRGNILLSLEELASDPDYSGCGSGYVCAKGTKPCYKNKCPASQSDCCCKCRKGVYEHGKCVGCKKRKEMPEHACEHTECPEYASSYWSGKKGKCKCKCNNGYKKKHGECKPKICYMQVLCKEPEHY